MKERFPKPTAFAIYGVEPGFQTKRVAGRAPIGTAKSPSPNGVLFQESASNRRLVYRPIVIVDADRREVDMGRRRYTPKLKTQG